jgi:dUTP pyrophosphatase
VIVKKKQMECRNGDGCGMGWANPVVYFERRHPDAEIPWRATKGSGGYDLTAVDRYWSREHKCWIFETGIALEFSREFSCHLFPRSNIRGRPLIMSPSPAEIDSDYRGTIQVCFKPFPFSDTPCPNPVGVYRAMDRVAQLVFVPRLNLTWTETKKLSQSARGTGGFGSTGGA